MGGILLAVATVLMLRAGTRGAEVANVLTLPVALVGLVVALIGLMARPRVGDLGVLAGQAYGLAKRIAEQEARIRQRLLVDTGDARPADVRFAGPAAELVRWRPDGADDDGSLATIAEFYRGLRRGRLVILGEPGAGKTMLAIELLLRLIGEALSGGCRTEAVVPVRLSLPALLPGGHDMSTPEAVRRRLDAWIVEQLVTSYGLQAEIAGALVAQGAVLPVLDGLDEMDADGAEPVRARAVVGALNLPAGTELRTVVITCRTDRYRQLGQRPVPDVLQDATAVVMQPLSVEQVVGWLTYRFPGTTQAPAVTERWRQVVAHLRAQPTGELMACLASPLRLYLTVTAYQDPSTSPSELIDIPAAGLDAHLFVRLVPAAIRFHPCRDGSHYDSDNVTMWLCTLARHLNWMAANGGSGTDLHLHEIWRSTGNPERPGRAARYRSAVIAGALTALPISVFVLTFAVVAPDFGGDGVFIGGLGVAFLALTVSLAAHKRIHPTRINLHHLTGKAGRREDWVSLLLLLLTGALLSIEYSLLAGILVAGLIGVMGLGLITSSSRPVQIDQPGQVVQGVVHDLIVLLCCAIGITLISVGATTYLIGPDSNLAPIAALGLAIAYTGRHPDCSGLAVAAVRRHGPRTPPQAPTTSPARAVHQMGLHRRPDAPIRQRRPIPPPRIPILAHEPNGDTHRSRPVASLAE